MLSSATQAERFTDVIWIAPLLGSAGVWHTLRDKPLNSLEFECAATTGMLLLFPAWLEHGVRPSRTQDERSSIAWNLIITGPLGSHDELAYSEV